MATKWSHAGAVKTTSAKIKARVESISPPTAEDKFKVYALENKWPADPGTFNVWCNGEIVDTVGDVNMYLSNLINLLVGGDGDNHRGHIAEIMGYATGWDGLPSSEIINYQNYLADKWLPTGDVLASGHTVLSTEGTEPSFSTAGAQDGIGKWFQMDETSIVDDGTGSADAWNDKIAYSGVIRTCTYFDYNNTGLKLPIQSGAGKNGKDLIYFNGDNSFIYDNFASGNDPAYAVVFVVAKFDDFSDNNNKSVIGSVSDEPYGSWNRLSLKKYSVDVDLRATEFLAGYKNLYVPAIKIENQDPAVESIDVQIEWSALSDFSGSYTSPVVTVQSPSYVAEFYLNSLTDNIKYYYRFLINGVVDNSYTGEFKTFKDVPYSFNFVAGSCQTSSGDNTLYSSSEVFNEIRNSNPEIFIHLGDLHYEDIAVNNVEVFREAFDGVMSQPRVLALWSTIPIAYCWDDHDYGPNNSAKDSPSREAALQFYGDSIAHYDFPENDIDKFGVSQAWTIGRVRFIMPDNRANRDPFSMAYDDPNKSIWGAPTKQWFKDQVLAAKNDDSIALIVWADPASWSGETTNPYDWVYGLSVESWSAFLEERKEISNFLYDNQVKNMLHICGDTHMQAIDDGRNMMYVTDSAGEYLTKDQINKDLHHICVEASPFDRAVGLGGAKFQINDEIASGGPYPLNEETWTEFKVTDTGENWIQVRIEQWQYRNQTPVLIRNWTFNKEAVGPAGTPPEITDNPKPIDYEGSFKVPENIHGVKRQTLEIKSPVGLTSDWKAEVDIKSNITSELYSNQQVEFYRVSDANYLIEIVDVDSDGIASFSASRASGSHKYILKNKTTGFQIGDQLFVDINFGPSYEDLSTELYKVTDANYILQAKQGRLNKDYIFRRNSLISPGFAEVQLTGRGQDLGTFGVDDIIDVNTIVSYGHTLETNDRFEFKGREYTITYAEPGVIYITPPLPDTNFTAGDTLTQYELILYANSVKKLKLPRSYELSLDDPAINTSFPKRSYVYDAALAVIASIGTENYSIADDIVEDLSIAQLPSGSFPFSIIQNTPKPESNDAYIRNGAVSWVAYSLAFFLKHYPSSENTAMVENMLHDVLASIQTYRDGTIMSQANLVRGGSGIYGANGFDPSYEIGWFSTEHNIDAYEAFKLAGEVLNNEIYIARSKQIYTSLMTNAWDEANSRFYQGIQADGNPDTADALDCNSWGAMMLMSAGAEVAKIDNLLLRCEQYYRAVNPEINAEGYKPYSPLWGYPNAVDNVWFEGSFGVAMAYAKRGDTQMFDRIMSSLRKFQAEDGAFRYAVLRDETYEISNNKSVASTAWYVMAEIMSDIVWESEPLNLPEESIDETVPQNFTVEIDSIADNPTNFNVLVENL